MFTKFRCARQRPYTWHRFSRDYRFGRFCKDTSGGVLIYSAFAIALFMGVVGLGIDVSTWHVKKRMTQTAADAAALAGAIELVRSDSDASLTAAVHQAATMHDYDPNAGADVTFFNPPNSGDFAGDNNAVEVIVRDPGTVFFGKLVFSTPPVVTSRAVAFFDPAGTCAAAGILSQAVSKLEQAAVIGSGFCVYGRNGVQLSQDVTVDPDGTIGALDVNTITYQQGFTGDPNSFFEGNQDLSIADDVAGLINDIESGGYVLENISSVEVVGSLPADPVAGTAYIINGNLNIDQDFSFQDGLLAVRGEIVIGQNGSITNSYGTCPNGEPGVGIVATQKVHLNQGANVQGAQIISGGNLQIEQNANFSGSAIVRGEAQVQQTPVLSDCVNTVGAELGIFAWTRLVE